MSVSLIVDDLFIQSAYKQFLKIYAPVYGDKVKHPLSILALSCAAASYLGKEITETHVFYLSDRPSSFLQGHMTQLAKAVVAEQEGVSPGGANDEIPEKYLVNYVHDALNIAEEELLGRSTEAHFHACDILAIEAAQYTAHCNSAILVADDPIYEMAKKCPNLIFIRYGNHGTRMPPDVRWLDVAYLFCAAYGVSP